MEYIQHMMNARSLQLRSVHFGTRHVNSILGWGLRKETRAENWNGIEKLPIQTDRDHPLGYRWPIILISLKSENFWRVMKISEEYLLPSINKRSLVLSIIVFRGNIFFQPPTSISKSKAFFESQILRGLYMILQTLNRQRYVKIKLQIKAFLFNDSLRSSR